ncbi:MAG: hypothetical protein PVF05_04660 [Gemmatimonadales bacterium]|jgi:hypothetical protein
MADERRAVEALRSGSGLTLVVWPASGRRAVLREGRRLADLDVAEIDALHDTAAPLTATETVIEVEGEPWLVQQTGPAWAEPAEASADLCGIQFLRLDGSERCEALAGRPPGPLPDDSGLRGLLDDLLRVEAGGEA